MYKYFLENLAKTNIENRVLLKNNIKHNDIYILCYHVTDTLKYPFIQFMVDKIPFCDDIVKEEFTLPLVFLNNTTSIETIVIEKVKISLKSIGIDYMKVTNEMYKGVILDLNNSSKIYALVNITGINISGLQLSRNSSVWFVLPTEIINTKKVCNIDIDDELTKLFTSVPQLGLLTNPNTQTLYMMPDAVYTGAEYKDAEFISVFGNIKTKEYDSCGEYYYFFKSFNNSIKYGGWSKKGGNTKIDMINNIYMYNSTGRLIIDNEYGRHICGAINRHALFIDGRFHMEINNDFTLNDDEIFLKYPEPTIIICYSGVHKVKPDILVKSCDYFSSLSYHVLDISTLDNQYVENNSNYTIL